jgi:hypothetical protein
MGFRPLRFGLILALILGLTASAGAGLRDARALFYQACLNLERQDLRATETWSWIEDLCRQQAELEVKQFSTTDRAGRKTMLADLCKRWYERNVWRLPAPLQADTDAQRDYVATVCDQEAVERLDALGE